MLTATYGESVTSTPMYDSGEPSGPMLNGTTYMVRPFMQPRKRPPRMPRISSGSFQLFVGPAPASVAEQMNVRSSTRATSDGSVAAQYEFGRFWGSSGTNVPAATRSAHSWSASASEPSNQWIASGSVSAAISSTQASSRLCLVGAFMTIDTIRSFWSPLSAQLPPQLRERDRKVYRRPCDAPNPGRG